MASEIVKDPELVNDVVVHSENNICVDVKSKEEGGDENAVNLLPLPQQRHGIILFLFFWFLLALLQRKLLGVGFHSLGSAVSYSVLLKLGTQTL